jgi:hypothetical protein
MVVIVRGLRLLVGSRRIGRYDDRRAAEDAGRARAVGAAGRGARVLPLSPPRPRPLGRRGRGRGDGEEALVAGLVATGVDGSTDGEVRRAAFMGWCTTNVTLVRRASVAFTTPSPQPAAQPAVEAVPA